MQTVKYLVFVALCSLSFGENIFYRRLDKLLDHCLVSEEGADAGILLGIAFARNQLLSDKESFRTEILLEKCEKLGKQFERKNEFGERSTENEIYLVRYVPKFK